MTKLQLKIKEYGQQRLCDTAGINKSQISTVMNGHTKGFGKKPGYRISKILNVDLAIALGLEN